MKILLAADGSSYTKKALAYLVTHEEMIGEDGEIVVLNVQPQMPPRVRAMVGASAVNEYQGEEAEKVLKAITRFLARHKLNFRTRWAVGHAGTEIIRAAQKEKVNLIVMGTHGHGIVGRALMGSVAQHVVTDAGIPVLLVK